MVGPCVGIVGRRFAEIIEAGPYKLSDHPWIVIVHGEIQVGDIAPVAEFRIVARRLMIVVDCIGFKFQREDIRSA